MSSDSELQKAVLAELEWEPSVTAAHIGVAANGGVVTLTGHVESFAERYAAETAAHRVKGVMAVAEEIEVELPFDRKRGDDEIASAALDRLAWDVSVPRDSVKVNVEQGWVTLTGEVDWHFQREAAEQDIRRLSGVVGVSNQTVIKPTVSTVNLRDNIMTALHRSWFSPTTIVVTADDGKVRLTGTVQSPHDREVAIATAWAASGATDVESLLAVI